MHTMKPWPVEIALPDLARFAHGNTGVPYVFTFDSGKPGPRGMLCALTHGNEVCGAIALAALLDAGVRLRSGQLTVAFNNIQAYQQFDPSTPDASRFVDEDFNRVWSEHLFAEPPASAERRRAREIAPFVASADYLLDIHSMHEPCAPLFVVGPRTKNLRFARALRPDIACVVDQGHAQGVRMRDFAAFDDNDAAAQSTLIECGQHWAAAAPTVALDAVARFLVVLGLVERRDLPAEWFTPEATPAPVFEVTHAIAPHTDAFRFTAPFTGLEVLNAGDVLAFDGDTPIKIPYENCTLIMPSARHAKPGVTVVRLAKTRA